MTSLVAQLVKNLPAMQETQVQFLDREDPFEKGMATHLSVLPWRIPWTKKPGGLQSTELKRVGQDWATFTSLSTPLIMRHGVTVCLIRAQQWFMKFLPKRHNLNLIKMIHQANSHGGTFCKITGQCSSKVSRSRKTKKDWGRNWFRLEGNMRDEYKA